MNETITITEHAAILYGCGFTLLGSLAGVISYRLALWLQGRDKRKAKTWELSHKSPEQRYVDEAVNQYEKREHLRKLARKMKPE